MLLLSEQKKTEREYEASDNAVNSASGNSEARDGARREPRPRHYVSASIFAVISAKISIISLSLASPAEGADWLFAS